MLEKTDGRARLRVAQGGGPPDNTVKLSPRVRSELLDNGAIATIPLHLIGPFLNEAVIYSTDELLAAPRIVAPQEGQVSMYQDQLAYVRGDMAPARPPAVPEPTPLIDSTPGRCSATRPATSAAPSSFAVPASKPGQRGSGPSTFRSWRLGTTSTSATGSSRSPRVTWTPTRRTRPRSTAASCRCMARRSALGQNQIVTFNRGRATASSAVTCWPCGARARPPSSRREDATRDLQLPNERIGLLIVFRVFNTASSRSSLGQRDGFPRRSVRAKPASPSRRRYSVLCCSRSRRGGALYRASRAHAGRRRLPGAAADGRPAADAVAQGRLDLRAEAGLAVVGSRNPDTAGPAERARLRGPLRRRAACIVSGLALGIDGAAHQGALEGPGRRDSDDRGGRHRAGRVYPEASTAHLPNASGAGSIISEYPIGTPPLPATSRARNRLISALARARWWWRRRCSRAR